MKLKPIIVLTLIFLALLRFELPCGCAESQNINVSTVTVSVENTDGDLCVDCGHKKSCCAHKKLTDSSSLIASIFSSDDIPFFGVVPAYLPMVPMYLRQGTIWNKAPPLRSVTSLYALGQKLSV